MHIRKQFPIKTTPERIWVFITNPEQVAPCIPGCSDVEVLGPKKYRATISSQVGPIKARFAVVVEARAELPPKHAEYTIQGEEGGNASTLSAVNTLTIEQIAEAECLVSYESEVDISGRLGKFGSGVMRKIADGVGDKFVAALRQAIEESEARPVQGVPESPGHAASEYFRHEVAEQPVGGHSWFGRLLAWMGISRLSRWLKRS